MPPQVDASGRPKYEVDLNAYASCPNCKDLGQPINLIEDWSTGDAICGDCGLVLGSHLVDNRQETRAFDNDGSEPDPCHTGQAGDALLDGGVATLATAISKEGARAFDLTRAQHRQTDMKKQASHEHVAKIMAFVDSLGGNRQVEQTAIHVFALAEEWKMRFRCTDAGAAGAILHASRQLDCPYSYKAMAAVTRVSKKDIGDAYNKLKARLAEKKEMERQGRVSSGESGINNVSGFKKTETANAADFVTRAVYAVGLKSTKQELNVERVAKEVAKRAMTLDRVCTRSPLSIASASIWFACKLLEIKMARKEIAKTVGVSDGVTLTVYKYIVDAKAVLNADGWMDKEGNVSKL